MSKSAFQRVQFMPECHADFDNGVQKLVDAIAPTLGPFPRMVAIERGVSTVSPEILDSGSAIARRITSLSNPNEDPGAMFIRGVLHRIFEEVRDGTAAAAVLFSAVLREGRRAVAAGMPVQPLRGHLERLADDVYRAVMAQARPAICREVFTSVARSACHDAELAGLLGDAVDVVGEYGQVDLRSSHRRESWREFVRGSYWDSGLLSTTEFRNPVEQRTVIHDSAVLLSNLALERQDDAVRLLTALRQTQAGGLIVFARSISSEVKRVLYANSDLATFPIVVIKAPQEGLEDLAVMTGGQLFLSGAGDSLNRIAASSFGHARTVWTTSKQFGLVSGQGDPQMIRAHVQALTKTYRRSSSRSKSAKLLRERLGRFQGTSATIWIGAGSDAESKHRQNGAERGVEVLRHALADGVVPGGGSALVHCGDMLHNRLAASADDCERFALRIVDRALRAPAATILHNAGYEPTTRLAAISRLGSPAGFNVLDGSIGDMQAMGIVDPARVVAVGARGAIRSAALALSIDIVIHTKSTDISVNPE